jgi:WS/DGAT/MGAT family acyltransferase
MQQLSGLDASFLYLETANSPMHIASLSIYDPSTAPGGKVGFKQILANTQARARRVTALTNTLVEVPLSLDHPYWRSDADFDPEFHIRHIALPKPGDWRQLCIQASRLHARPLDRAHPLWEMYIIEGLDNVEGYPPGCFAVMTKMHHAAVDGASGVEIAAAIHDLEPVAGIDEDYDPVQRESVPTALELIWRAQVNNIKTPFRFISVARNTIPGFARFATGLAKGKLNRVSKIPRTRFNTTVSPHRVFTAVQFDLKDVKAIKSSIEGVTVNDVAIAICGGALRKYLVAKKELPQRSLAAMAPINIRTKDKLGTAGNQVSQMTVKVCSDVEEPVERLLAVHHGTQQAKELTNAIGAKSMTDYSQFIPSTLTASAARVASRIGLANRGAPIYNCVITNVPGPQIPLYFTGAKMLSSFGMGPAIDGTGLFQAIGSYCGSFNIAVSCCREMMPDPDFYQQCLQESFDELFAATQALSNPESKKKAKKVKKKARKKVSKKS